MLRGYWNRCIRMYEVDGPGTFAATLAFTGRRAESDPAGGAEKMHFI